MTAPGVPTGVTATAGNGTVTLTFSAGTGGAPTSYDVGRNGTDTTGYGAYDGSASASPVVFDKLFNGTAYTVYVAARNADGVSTRVSVNATPFAPSGGSGITWYSGAYTDLDAPTLTGMGTWRGRAMDVASVFPSRGSSAQLQSNWYIQTAVVPSSTPIISVAVPMCYDGGSISTDISADIQVMANQFAADGRIFMIRLGWEFNLASWAWGVTDANAALWKTRFNAYAAIFRNTLAAGKVFIIFNPNLGVFQSGYSGTMDAFASGLNFDAAGPDAYDWYPPFTSTANINTQHTMTYGLDYWSNFCTSRGIQLCVPEWGCVSGSSATGNEGGDNPAYISEIMTVWLGGRPNIGTKPGVLFDTYFQETQSYLLSDIYSANGTASNPNAGIRYRSLFAATASIANVSGTGVGNGGAGVNITVVTNQVFGTGAGTSSIAATGSASIADRSITGRCAIEFVPGSGVFVDVSNYLFSDPAIIHPRTGDATATATIMNLTLTNSPDPITGFSPFTPDSPVSPYYPNITKDRRIKFTAYWYHGTANSQRFLGWIDTWIPDYGDGTPGSWSVAITASCVLSRYDRYNLHSDYGEALMTPGNGDRDYWPFDEPADATTVQGYAPGWIPYARGNVVSASSGSGDLSFNKPDGTILVDGGATFTRSDTGRASPVIVVPTRLGHTQLLAISRVSAWFSLSQDPVAFYDDMMAGYDITGACVWRLQCRTTVQQTIQYTITDFQAASIYTFWDSGASRNDGWIWLSILFYADSSGNPLTGLAVRTATIPDVAVAGGFTGWPTDPRTTSFITVGGLQPPTAIGNPQNTMLGSVSSLDVRYTSPGNSVSDRSAAAVIYPAGAGRMPMLQTYSNQYDVLVGGGVTDASGDVTPVMLTGANATLLDAWNEHAITVHGDLCTLPSGQRRFRSETAARPTAVALTLDAGGDLDLATAALVPVLDERPTRITASSPAGSVTFIDTATETKTGFRLDGGSLSTAAGTPSGLALAASRPMSTVKARYSFGVDVSVAATDLTIAIMALTPGDRIRTTGLDPAAMGVTYLDHFASGWTETYVRSQLTVQFVFDTDPADDPVIAVLDSAEFGRFGLPAGSTVSGGTCIGGTGTGTVIVSATGPAITTTDVPFDLDWNGERVTVSAVSGATCTVVARGVAPTVARPHASGEPVDGWHSMTFG